MGRSCGRTEAHKGVLSTIDDKFLPNATNGEVKTMLTEMRQTVTNRL